MRAKAFVAVVASTLVLCSCATSPAPPVTGRASPASPSPRIAESSSSPKPSAWRAALVVYQTDLADDTPVDVAGDLWVYDVRRNDSKRLTADGDRSWDSEPRFRLPRTLTYVSQGEDAYVVHELDLDNGERRVLLEEPAMFAMGWNPDGSQMAWASDRQLLVRKAADGSTTRRWYLPPYPEIFGRGGHSADERSVSWSPAGDAILVTDTARCCYRQREETIFVYRADGSLVASMRGTFARWAADGRSVYFSDFEVPRLSLRNMSIASGVATRLPVEGAYRISPSPDGRFIAYDTDGETPHVHVWDTVGEFSRELGPGLAPLWLSHGEVAATLTRPCGNPDECVDVRWHGIGRSIVYSLDGSPAREIALASTRDAVAT